MNEYVTKVGNVKVCVAVIRKGGSLSIDQALMPAEYFGVERALEFPVRVAFVREPMERYASSFSFFTHQYNRMGENDTVTGDVPPVEVVNAGYHAWVDWTLDEDPMNRHWIPQVEQLTYEGVLVPTEIHRFEDIHDHWERLFGPGMLPHINAASRLPTDDYRTDDINNRYEQDLALWQSLHQPHL